MIAEHTDRRATDEGFVGVPDALAWLALRSPWHRLLYAEHLGPEPRLAAREGSVPLATVADGLAHHSDSYVGVAARVAGALLDEPGATGVGLLAAVARLGAPEDRMRARALIVMARAALGTDPARARFGPALEALTFSASDLRRCRAARLRASPDRSVYEAAHASAAALLSAPSAPLDEAERDDAESVLRITARIGDLFLAARGAGTLLLALTLRAPLAAHGECAAQCGALLLSRLQSELGSLESRAYDGLHTGCEYATFALSLATLAAARIPACEASARRLAPVLMDRFGRLPARSQASQALFYIPALRSCASLDSTWAQSVACDVTVAYLESARPSEPTDYLRCAYLGELITGLGLGSLAADELARRSRYRLERLAHGPPPSSQYEARTAVAAYCITALATVAPGDLATDAHMLEKSLRSSATEEPYGARGARALAHALVDIALQRHRHDHPNAGLRAEPPAHHEEIPR